VKKLARQTFLIALRVFALGVTVIVTIWVIRGLEARKMADLQVWHSYDTEEEFRARDYPSGISLGEYRELEARLFAELDDNVYATINADNGELFNRYNKLGKTYPGDDGQAWNRSFSIETANPVGGILLLHGASDSPYSVKALAELFASRGLYVAGFRLPGHGTIPTGLKNVDLEDWVAITRAGAKHVADTLGSDIPFYIGGYSAGAALAVDYVLDASVDDSLPMPSRLFLYSPSIAVTPFARFSDWDLALAKIPYFEKMAWTEIETEYDPYKYNSFPKNGGYLAFTLSENIAAKLALVNESESAAMLPPMIAFQSLVDSTVRTDSLVHDLYEQLPENGHELVLFDVNRAESIQHFMIDSERDLLDELAAIAPTTFSYTLVTNRDELTTEVQARTRAAGGSDSSDVDLPYVWPAGVYSLSHVAIPYAPTDAWYGSVDEEGLARTDSFNNMAPRGEQAILAIPLGRLMRLRYNPFFGYVESRTIEFCEVCL
jgi:alpha-beta hydrolase superfamily lysophospholipase